MQEHLNTRITLSGQAWKTLLKDVCQRQHIEACGLLLGHIDSCENWRIEQAHPLRNIYNSPVYFEFAPEDLLAVELDFPGQIIGVYHSHPTGYPQASSTDRENMQRVNVEQHIPWAWLIICGPFNDLQEQLQEQFPPSRAIAYHHYEQEGL